MDSKTFVNEWAKTALEGFEKGIEEESTVANTEFAPEGNVGDAKIHKVNLNQLVSKGEEMKFGDKTGKCECCDVEEVPLQYSRYFIGYLCAECWDRIAESVISGE
ncbi:hypothetical protein [Bacillus sp. 0102A]|uniref:hypothetical protein n=1 Tax=Bacillus sp. 0102A TaxID=3120563 RepID=UPI002FD9156D